jgi:hypothetical protein
MVGGLITFPLRVGVRATQLWLRAAEETVAVVADATGRLIETVVAREETVAQRDAVVEHDAPPYEASVSPGPAAAYEHGPPLERDKLASDEQVPEPVHVSEEPELVEEVAEPGVEDGAGASVHVEEPWDGYEQMKADDVIDRLAGATPAELAAIQLYESEGKSRTTVIQAVERELRIATGSGSQR